MAIPAELLQLLRCKKDLEFLFGTMLLSYAEEDEDALLYAYLHPIAKGLYVDVGASHPVEKSVTKFFYEKGWRGINIDPVPSMIELYAGERPEDTNLCLACSDAEGEKIFYEGDVSSSTLSTFDPSQVATMSDRVFSKTTVKTDTLANIFARYIRDRDVHFLKIDAELHEESVLQGMDFKRFRPWILVLEAERLTKTEDGALVHTESWMEWEYLLTKHAYSFLKKHGHNRYYCAAEKKDSLEKNYLQAPFFTIVKSVLYPQIQAYYEKISAEAEAFQR